MGVMASSSRGMRSATASMLKYSFLPSLAPSRVMHASTWSVYRSLGGRVWPVKENVGKAAEGLKEKDIIVDAIFGTGLTKEVRGAEAVVIEEINRSEKPVIAVDIPSGLDGLRGTPLGTAVRAVHTYTYGYPKLGQALLPWCQLQGKVDGNRYIASAIRPGLAGDRRVPRRRADAPAILSKEAAGGPQGNVRQLCGHCGIGR